MKVAVIGGGPVGIICANEILHKIPGAEVTIFGRGQWGHGLVYGENELASSRQSFITEKMGVSAQDDQALMNWIKENRETLNYPSEDLQADSLPPRSLIGEYFSDQIESVRDYAAENSISFETVESEVTGLSKEAGLFSIKTNQKTYMADTVFLALGNFPSAVASHLKGCPRYYPEIWGKPIFDVAPDDRVLVIGSGLSSIDVLNGLKEFGHQGVVTFASRTGILPAIAGEAACPIDLSGISEKPTAAELLDVIQVAVEGQGGPNPWEKFAFDTDTSLAQAAVGNMAENIVSVWQRMDPKEKKAFDRYSAFWNAYHIPVFEPNASLIKESLDNGYLRVSTDTDIRFEANRFHNSSASYDVVFNATGRNTDPTSIDSDLIRSILANDLAAPDPLGGFQVSSVSETHTSGLYCLGSLTRGSRFYTYVLSENAKQTAEAVASLAHKSK